MELNSFREILIKKAEDNERLRSFIEYIGDETLLKSVMESLEKMAKLSRAAARNPNGPLLEFAGKMGDDDVHMLRDAIGHHVAHYKNALKNMHASQDPTEKSKLRALADQHLGKIVPLAHLAARSEHHSKGRIAADLPPIRAWQANYTGHHKFKDYPAKQVDADGKVSIEDPVRGVLTKPSDPNKEIIGTEGWGGRPTGSRKINHDYNKSRSTPDWRYLEMPINDNHDESKTTNHKGAFPFEDIRIGSPDEVDKGEGHLHIEDVDPSVKEYVPHEFDSHPINEFFNIPDKDLTDQQRAKFANEFDSWKDSDNYNNYLNRHESLESFNPDTYKTRGSKKPSHIYEGMPLQEQPNHAKSSKVSSLAASPSVAPVSDIPLEKPKTLGPNVAAPSAQKPKAIITRKNRE